MISRSLLAVATASIAALIAAGCTTESYCFDCDQADAGLAQGGSGGGGAQDAGGDGYIPVQDAADEGIALPDGGDTGADGPCEPTNGGVEACDGIDNDCNGLVDDGAPDGTELEHCGPCNGGAKNCALAVQNADEATCEDGVCGYKNCSTDWWDVNKDPSDGCEYYCVIKSPNAPDDTCDGIDDDCDGIKDDGVNFCEDATNCGRCGRNCQGKPNSTGKCVKLDDAPSCNDSNTKCVVDRCDDGWIDANGSFADGCEYQCRPTKRTDPNDPSTLTVCDPATDPECGTVEYCDGVDNDCNGRIDGIDPNMTDPTHGDPTLGKECYGNATQPPWPAGVCQTPPHRGITRCVAAQVKCVNDNTGTTSCTNDADCTDPATPYCIDAPTAGEKVCGTRVLRLNENPETCNNLDDNCDGQVDNSPTDVGASCGSSVGTCRTGKEICENGALVCSGQVNPQPEVCNGVDDNCDGVIDGIATTVACLTDDDCAGQATARFCMQRASGTDKVCSALPIDVVDASNNPIACDVPAAPPSGWTSPCRAGVLSCVGGLKRCAGSVTATAATDTCGEDRNCNGMKDPNFDLTSDVANCGACGHDCRNQAGAGSMHVNWACQNSTCVPDPVNPCQPGYHNLDNNLANGCEYACTFLSQTEYCNGVDDNCDGTVDEMKDAAHPNGIVAPSPVQLCGVNVAATEPACTQNVVSCQGGAWKCTFPAGYCDQGSPASCATTPDVCDGKDNNCNGNTDENFKPPIKNDGYLGQTCFSSANGLCRSAGVYVCNGTNATRCNAQVKTCDSDDRCTCFNPDPSDPAACRPCCTERCDGLDNDCDGSVDEVYTAKGSNITYWVKPDVVQVGSKWVYKYEASRHNATNVTGGSGNGWWKSSGLASNQPAPPSGTPLEKTSACSVQNRIPWFNISGLEAQHVCVQMGGRLCRNTEWQDSCESSTGACGWGFAYNCSTFTSNTTTCNLGPYDFNASVSGNQDGLLPTGYLANCRASFGSTTASVFDITGNLRELTCPGSTACTNSASQSFVLMGGAFNSSDPTGNGSRCDFTFYNVGANFKLYDVGFRCCFDSNPS